MDTDFNAYHRGEFPVDQPMDALRTDHDLARVLFERYFRSHDAEEKKRIGRHILLLLEMHTSLEELVFYPRVRDIDSLLVEHCEKEHDEATQMIKRLRLMNDGDPQADQMFGQLADAVLRHVDTEERELFPKVEQANLDMSAIGHEMQACETRMIAAHTQRPTAPGVRP